MPVRVKLGLKVLLYVGSKAVALSEMWRLMRVRRSAVRGLTRIQTEAANRGVDDRPASEREGRVDREAWEWVQLPVGRWLLRLTPLAFGGRAFELRPTLDSCKRMRGSLPTKSDGPAVDIDELTSQVTQREWKAPNEDHYRIRIQHRRMAVVTHVVAGEVDAVTDLLLLRPRVRTHRPFPGPDSLQYLPMLSPNGWQDS